ncbi:MAG: aminotransferase class I/II-fold pyridoxal phosphate-dependent enzyme, partial [Burkholderiaceae bacterium]
MDTDERFARCLHHSTASTDFGDAFSPPIVNTSLYRLAADPSGVYQYARWANPTWAALEEALSVFENAETVTFPSGMAAIAAVLYSTLKSGDRVLLPSDGYYTVRIFAEKYLSPMSVTFDVYPTAEVAARALDGYKLVWIETPSNPGLDLADIAAVAHAAKTAGAITVVDNTTMTPLGQRPLDLNADLVVSADT